MTRHSAILTNLLLSLPLAAGLLCTATSASAQLGSSSSETVTIPFAFTANHQQFPAGTYQVRRLPDGVMSLYNLQTARIQLLLVRREDGRVVETRGRLVFYHDETGNSLMQVWEAGTTIHSDLMVQPKLHQLVAKNNPESTFEVAMK